MKLAKDDPQLYRLSGDDRSSPAGGNHQDQRFKELLEGIRTFPLLEPGRQLATFMRRRVMPSAPVATIELLASRRRRGRQIPVASAIQTERSLGGQGTYAEWVASNVPDLACRKRSSSDGPAGRWRPLGRCFARAWRRPPERGSRQETSHHGYLVENHPRGLRPQRRGHRAALLGQPAPRRCNHEFVECDRFNFVEWIIDLIGKARLQRHLKGRNGK
jgi:hypothetical protein